MLSSVNLVSVNDPIELDLLFMRFMERMASRQRIRERLCSVCILLYILAIEYIKRIKQA